jgi:hypothetical protein
MRGLNRPDDAVVIRHMKNGMEVGRVVWLIVRCDEPNQGDFCSSERRAVLKAAWLKRQNVEATVVRAVIQTREESA